MKKSIFTMSLFIMTVMCLNLEAKSIWCATTPSKNLTNHINAGVRFVMYGVIGQSESAIMTMNGTTGTFEYAGAKKKLVFKSYNYKTKQLILSEYNKKGQYVGKFVGKYIISRIYPFSSYIGKFTNVNGHTTEFALHEPAD